MKTAIIYYSRHHENTKQLLDGKDVFFIYTYGAKKSGYTNAIRESLSDANARILGEYGCYGYNTFGPFKLIGGIAKNHSDKTDLENAVSFYNNLRK